MGDLSKARRAHTLQDGIRIEALRGPQLAAAVGDVARLRIAVFRDWPYLYDGTLEYEQNYLAGFVQEKDAVVIAAYDDGRIVGAATAAPLGGHTQQFVPLFAAAGYDPAAIFYCGESVLLQAYRGRGIGHVFFDLREASARATGRGYTHSAFCSVVRSLDDPRAPASHVPLDGFWRKRGYLPVEGLVGHYPWREVGQPANAPGDNSAEIEHPMQFWMRAL